MITDNRKFIMADSASLDVIEILKSVVKEDIENFIINVEHNKKGEGYLGEISYLTLKQKNGEKSYNFVVKKAINNEDVRKKYPIRDVFVNEIYFYTDVWKKFREFQSSVPLVKMFDKIPKCFATSKEEFSEMLILENIKLENFVIFSKFNSFNADHVEFIFRTYGRFHAISFAYRALHPEEFSQMKELKDLWHKFNNSYNEFFKYVNPIIRNGLLPEDQKTSEKYRYFAENFIEIFNKNLIYEGEYSAVLHGDCWSNNMLFKYDTSGKVVDLRLIDFQLAKVGTPICDLSYSLYSGAGKEIYEDLDRYLRVYHNSFSETVKEFGCDPNSLYPFAALKDDWKKYCKFGFTMSLLTWMIRLTYEENIIDLTEYETAEKNNTTEKFLGANRFDEETYRKITRDLVIHMCENDFL